MKYFLLLVFIFSSAIASECTWIKLRGSEMMAFDSDLSFNKYLSQDEVESDLKCLKILFENYYIAQKVYGEKNLLLKLNQEISNAKPLSSRELMARMFALHSGMTDIHLSYTLGDEVEKFKIEKKKSVKLSEELDHDIVYEREGTLYFRPGSLTHFSIEQKSFIDMMGRTDKDLILDLRGNGGGGDDFAYALSEALFTNDQKIPQARRYQLNSPLQRIGFSLSLIIHGYDAAESFRTEVRSEVELLTFQSLLSYQVSEEVEKLKGKRAVPFKSRITLITDGECASSCETIVEKISKHPNAKVIGTNTLGALHFSNVATYMLPFSGIVIKLPSLLHLYENDAPEGVGYLPDEIRTYVDLSSLIN